VPNLDSYMAQYEHEHHNLANRVLHSVGIPLIFAGIVLLFVNWRWGLVLFAGGWVMLFLGHRIEGNKPAFFQGPVYFLMGPLWVARELKELLFGSSTRQGSHAPPATKR
jgi:hypothetical protein